jgi:hypothetical protein
MDRRSLLRGIVVAPIAATAPQIPSPQAVKPDWRELQRRLSAGTMTVNQVRAEYGLPPVEDLEIKQ